MIQETALRFDVEMYHNPVFICSADHAVIIREQMKEINVEVGGFLIEPVARNTAAPAVVAALHALELEEDALVLVVPADHHIERPDAFRRAVAAGAPVAAHGHLMTFGITPEYAATGFGYIRKGETLSPGAFVVDSFVEKPPADVAEEYLASGEYYWNSGIFLFKAVMEHTQKAGVLPCSLGWHDIGSFKALHELRADDEGLSVKGDVRLANTRNCLIDTDGPLVAAVGVENLAIIVKDGAVLVLNLDESQNVRDIVAQLKTDGTDFL